MNDHHNELTEDSEVDVSRRDFLKFCSMVAAAIGLGPAMGSKVAAALTSASRPKVLWLHFAECTACSEAVLRTQNTSNELQAIDNKAMELKPGFGGSIYSPHPYFNNINLSTASLEYFDDLIFNTISLDYHETLMAGAGSTVHDILTTTAEDNKGKFICVVEGAIPTKDNGVYGTVAGKTMLSIAQEICPKAKLIIAIGNCASFGGIPYAQPNPTGAKNVIAALKDLNLPQVLNVPGCPPHPVAFVGTVAYLLLKGTPPPTDAYLRPKFAYFLRVHDRCPNLYDYLKEENGAGICLRYQGCKGPGAYNICPTVKFNNGANYPVGARHVCIACSEPNFWDEKTPFWKIEDRYTPFKIKPLAIFEKDVSAMVVPDPLDGVLPYSKNHALEPTAGKMETKTYNALGRRVKSPIKNKNVKMQKQPMARGMFFEKTKDKVKKVLEF